MKKLQNEKKLKKNTPKGLVNKLVNKIGVLNILTVVCMEMFLLQLANLYTIKTSSNGCMPLYDNYYKPCQ